MVLGFLGCQKRVSRLIETSRTCYKRERGGINCWRKGGFRTPWNHQLLAVPLFWRPGFHWIIVQTFPLLLFAIMGCLKQLLLLIFCWQKQLELNCTYCKLKKISWWTVFWPIAGRLLTSVNPFPVMTILTWISTAINKSRKSKSVVIIHHSSEISQQSSEIDIDQWQCAIFHFLYILAIISKSEKWPCCWIDDGASCRRELLAQLTI